MKARNLLVAALLLAVGLAALPPAQASDPPEGINPPPQCYTQGCCFAACPMPEVPPVDSEPSCKPVDRYDVGGAVHTVVESDCHVRIDYKAYDCVWDCGWHTVVDSRYLTIREYSQNDPETSSASAAAPPGIQPPPQCVTSPCCFAPCPPPCDVNCPTPVRCPEASSNTVGDLITFGDLPVPTFSAWTNSDCTSQTCVDQDKGLCDAQACTDGTATCCDLGARSHACACPAASVATSDLLAYLGPHAGVSVDEGCNVLAWEHGLQCAIGTDEANAHAGPLTVEADICMPSLDCTCDPLPIAVSAMAAPIPPMQCVMDPCFPQCIVPCVPQVVPRDCELREATPETVGPFLIPANPRTLVWGSDPSDCTVDVEPAYMCVGGWGTDRHIVVGFVDVTVRLCGQPLPPIS